MKKLDPGAIWFFFISLVLRWFLPLLILGIYWAAIVIDTNEETLANILNLVKWLWLIVPLLLILAYMWARLTYRFYRYELREDGFRKELGVIWKKYVTIPYDRIQNVDIYRGVVARLLGLSDLHIQTAGASAQYSRYGAWGLSAEGRLPGLSRKVAEELRDELIRRARNSRGQGL